MREILVNIILGIIIIVLIFYIIYIKRQIKSINNQVKTKINEQCKKPIEVMLIDKNLNDLIANFNKMIIEEEDLKLEAIKHENKLKEMTANISHDLRTPLTAIKGYLQLLNKSELGQKQRGLLNTALNHTNELDDLINNFFELSYLEISKEKVEFKKLNLTNIVTNNIMDYVQQFEEKNLEIEFNVEKPMYVFSDEKKVKRIIQNLIKNCLCHAKDKVFIDIVNNNKYVTLSFSNNVINPSEIDVESIFDRFYVADKSRNTSTGLGLSIVKVLSEQNNGKVKANINGNNLSIEVLLNKYKDLN